MTCPGKQQERASVQGGCHVWDEHRVCVCSVAQSCPTLCDPIDCSPPGYSVHGILQVRTMEWVAISSSNAWKWKVKVKSFSCVRLLATLWTAAYQAPPSMGLSRQEYCSGVPLPSPFFCEIQPKHIAVPATVAAAVYDVLSWQSLYLASICWFLEFFFFFYKFCYFWNTSV